MKAIIFAVALSLPNLSWASEWSVQVEDDVFNGRASAVVVGGASGTNSLYLSCSTDGDTSWSIIFKPSDDEFTGNVPANVTFKMPHVPVFRVVGKSYLHDEGRYWGFNFFVNHPSVYANFLAALASSEGPMELTLDIPSTKVQRTEIITLEGAQDSLAQFATACKIQNPTQ